MNVWKKFNSTQECIGYSVFVRIRNCPYEFVSCAENIYAKKLVVSTTKSDKMANMRNLANSACA